jgi:hypothetical protein
MYCHMQLNIFAVDNKFQYNLQVYSVYKLYTIIKSGKKMFVLK